MLTSQVDTKTNFIRFCRVPISKFAFRNIFGWSSPIIEHDLNSDKELSPKIFWLWAGDWFTMRGESRIIYKCIAGWKCLFYSKEDNCAETLNTKICSLIEFQSTKELQNINEGAPRDSLSLAFLFKTHGNVKIVTPQNLFDRKVPENTRTVMRTSISCYFMILLFWFCGNRENLEGEQENLMNIQKDILSPAKGPFDEEGKYSVFISLSLIKSPLPVWQAAKLPILKNTLKQQLFTGTGIDQKVPIMNTFDFFFCLIE